MAKRGFSFVSKIIVTILSLLKIALATAIIIIVATELYTITVYDWPYYDVVRVECLMAGKSVRNGDVCEYTYAVCGLSLLLSLVTSVLMCVTFDACGLGSWIEFIIEGFQTAWWVCASIVISTKVRETNDVRLNNGAKLPKESYRNAVAVIAWVTALLCSLTAIVCLMEAVDSLRQCCGWCCYKKSRGGKDHDAAAPVDYQNQPAGNPAYGAPPTVGTNDEAARANAV